MPENLSYNIYALLNEASTNDTNRPASLLFEAKSTPVTISSNSGTATVPTALKTILGVVCIAFVGGTPTALWVEASQPSSGTTTLTVKATISNGTYTLRCFLVGTKD